MHREDGWLAGWTTEDECDIVAALPPEVEPDELGADELHQLAAALTQ